MERGTWRGGMALLLASIVVGSIATPGVRATPGQYRLVESDADLLERADSSRRFGNGAAAVVIDEFFDFACPDCARFHATSRRDLEGLVEQEGVLFVARTYPLPRLMRGFQAAEAALCAGALGGREAFAGMEDRLFAGLESWRRLADPTPEFGGYAEQVGVPMNEWRDCVARDAMAPLILSDIQQARSAGISSTPTFVFNPAGSSSGRIQVSGSDALPRFPEAIERARRR